MEVEFMTIQEERKQRDNELKGELKKNLGKSMNVRLQDADGNGKGVLHGDVQFSDQRFKVGETSITEDYLVCHISPCTKRKEV